MAKKKQQQRNNKKKKNRNRNQAAATSQNTADADDRDAGAEYLTNSGNAMRAYQNLSEEEKANVNVEDLKKVCVRYSSHGMCDRWYMVIFDIMYLTDKSLIYVYCNI